MAMVICLCHVIFICSFKDYFAEESYPPQSNVFFCLIAILANRLGKNDGLSSCGRKKGEEMSFWVLGFCPPYEESLWRCEREQCINGSILEIHEDVEDLTSQLIMGE